MSAILMSRRYDVAEYFFGDEATEHLGLVEDAILHVYNDEEDCAIRAAFNYYLDGQEVQYSSGIHGGDTAGFGDLDEFGFWEFPLPATFIEKFLK